MPDKPRNAVRRIGLNAKLTFSFATAAVVGVVIGLITSPGDFPWVLKIIGGLWVLILLYFQTIYKESYRQARIQSAETYYRNNPVSTRAAWDLAQVKLESYVDKNLDQVRWIFILAVVVMLGGWALVFFGITRAYENPSVVTPVILSSISGVLTQLLGGTLLIIYRSTMSQAKDYVQMLERINAVGMAVQILERQPDDESSAREQARIEMAKQVLTSLAFVDLPASPPCPETGDHGESEQIH